MVQISKQLTIKKSVSYEESQDLTNSLDSAMADYYCQKKNYDKGLKLFKEILPKLEGTQKTGATHRYINYSLQYAQSLTIENKWIEAVEVYREIMKISGFPVNVYKNIGLCMKSLGNADLAIKFLKKFEEISPDKEDVYVYLADITYADIKDNIKAIEYYEKALVKNNNNFAIYNMLGHLYSTCYQDKYKDKQIDYLMNAYRLAPNNRIVVKNLAYVLGKFDEVEKADEFYAKLMYLNPTHSDLHSYGAYLVKHKRFAEGFKFLQHRFQKEDLGNVVFPPIFSSKKKRWNMKISTENKHILIHFEQGFGDSIMFTRFIDEAKKHCKKVSLVVQDGLIDLFNDSELGIDIYREADISKIDYDYYIPMMDLPILCNTTPETIPNTQKYLKVPQTKIDKYKKEHIIEDDSFKIGIAFEGTMASKETDRDIPLEYLYDLMRMKGVTVYSFQVDDNFRQMDRVPDDAPFIRLGRTFKNWEDTACAINCMDLMVTTDNGVMNLAGALGKKTLGLFNKITEWRWFKTDGDNIAWYESIKPFQAPTSKAWEVPVAEAMKEVEKLMKEKKATKTKGTSKTKTSKTSSKVSTSKAKTSAKTTKVATTKKQVTQKANKTATTSKALTIKKSKK